MTAFRGRKPASRLAWRLRSAVTNS